MDLAPGDFPTCSQLTTDAFLSALRLESRGLSDPEEIMGCCSRMLAEHLDVDRCAYASVEDESVFVITGDHCRGVPSIVGRWPVAAFGEECVRLMRANEPYVMNDVNADPRAGDDLAAYQATAIRSVICVPLHKDGKFTAAMAVHCTVARMWRNDEIELVGSVVASCWESLERARGNEQLKTTSTRLSLALLAAELGDWSWDPVADVVSLSERAAEIFGLGTRMSIPWKEMQELLPAPDRENTLAVLEEALKQRTHYDAEYRVHRPDGSQVWVSAKGGAQYDSSGNPIRMYGVVQDISKRKELEEELKRHMHELAEAGRKKDEFIALLAHELRNPLAPMLPGLELIRRSSNQPEIIAHVAPMLEAQISHMVHLIDDLLDVSRITKGKLSLRKETVELASLIAGAAQMAAPLLEGAALELTTSLPDQRITLEGDSTRLTQVLTNLLANSAKFSAPGTRVSITAVERNGGISITVTDEGSGIAADLLPKIFDMFVQAESGTAKGGLGVGLPLSRSLVEMHGGTLTAESDGLGKGSRFTVTLPVKEPSGH